MKGEPFDITILPGGQAAVTLPWEKQLQVISVSANTLFTGRSIFIAVSGHCFGICSSAQILVVTYTHPGKVEVMDHTGTALHTVSADMNGESLFKEPCNACIATEESKDVIYVSDWKTNKITKLTLDGEIRSTHTRRHWKTILGLTCVGEGQLLLCNNEGDTVELMNQGGDDVIPFILLSQGIEKPEAICYYQADAVLFISSNILDRPLSVFQLSEK